MIKISKLTDYAVVILAHMDQKPDEMLSASCLAASSHVPEPTVSKIIKLLSKADILVATRGASGGYRLKNKLSDISVKEILEAIEGPIHLTECVEHSHDCAIEKFCPSYGRWDNVNTVIRDALEDIKVSSLVVGKS